MYLELLVADKEELRGAFGITCTALTGEARKTVASPTATGAEGPTEAQLFRHNSDADELIIRNDISQSASPREQTKDNGHGR